MNFVWVIISIVIGFLFVGLTYWFWGLISGLLAMGAVWAGYGIGKILGITPRSSIQTNVIITVNNLLQIGIEWGLITWVIFSAIGLFATNIGWIERVRYYSSGVWLVCLVLDVFVLFIIGLMYGRVEKLLKKENKYSLGDDNSWETVNENNSTSQAQSNESVVNEEPQNKVCLNCKEPTGENARFCKNCGTLINQNKN